MVKHLKLLTDDNYGFMETNYKIGVSLSGLHKAFSTERRLINAVCIILHHEWLHYILEDAIWTLYKDGEEEIVERLKQEH